MVSQVGSMSDDTDYDVQNHVLYASALFTPTKRVSLNLDASYTKSKSDFDAIHFPGPPAGFTTWNNPSPAWSVAYTTDYTGFEDYSDLDQSRFECSLGCNVQLYKALELAGVVTYRKYTDDEPYLYDADGNLWIINVGLNYTF
jgi:hypothetical protein